MCNTEPSRKLEWGGLKINAKARELDSQMVTVETSIHSEFPATVPCLSLLDYFLVQGLLRFKASSMPTSVIQSYLGAYTFSGDLN